LSIALVAALLFAYDDRDDSNATSTQASPEASQGAVAEVAPRAIAPFVQNAIEWLASAQQSDGGWGSGLHTNQQLRDPHQVVTDPGTTAFTAMALMRVGNTPVSGAHQNAVRRATEYLLRAVEESPTDGPLITELTGTQPQRKMGRLIDTAMTTEFLARVLATLPAEHECACAPTRRSTSV
jgi:hypothetical protein